MVVKRKVHFHGHLAEELGRQTFTLAANSPAHALRIVDANYPGAVSRAFREGSYRIILGDLANDNALHPDMVDFNCPQGQDIHFVPVPFGSGGGNKGGVFGIILGVLLIAVAIAATPFTGGMSLAAAGSLMASTTFLGISMSSIALFGAALVLGGVAQLLTPTPSQEDGLIPDADVTSDNSDKRSSFLFNGVINSEEEGMCVPVCYGFFRCGSIVVSGGVFHERIDPNATDITSPAVVDVDI
jgi:predicted phage tail protein